MIDDDLGTLRDFATAWRPLSHADALQEQQLGRFVHRQAEAQRPDRLRQGGRARAEPPGRDGGHLARRRQDLRRRRWSSRPCRSLPRTRRAAPSRIIRRNMTDDMMRALAQERRRHDDQLRGQLPVGREPPGQARSRAAWSPPSTEMSKTCKGDEACSTLETAAHHPRGDGQGHAAGGVVGEDRRAHRPRRQGGRRRSRRPGLGLRRRHHADRHGGRLAVAQAHDRADGQGLLRRATSRRSSAATSCG